VPCCIHLCNPIPIPSYPIHLLTAILLDCVHFALWGVAGHHNPGGDATQRSSTCQGGRMVA
jgi:hypothetical protein